MDLPSTAINLEELFGLVATHLKVDAEVLQFVESVQDQTREIRP